jgi:ferredoxin
LIIAESKGIEEILRILEPYQKILVAGCRGCVTVCLAGGAKEVGLISSAIRLARKEEKNALSIREEISQRQCELEFNQELAEAVEEAEVILSLACGVGVQTLAEQWPDKIFLPGLNTKFMGNPVQQGVWEERCQGCGECLLDKTCGICPIARCSKSLLNGPCGGSYAGKCEVDDDTVCGWHLIYERASRLGQLARLAEINSVKDWSKARDYGPRRVVRGDMRLAEVEK